MIQGPPRDITIVIRWTATQDDTTLNGALYVKHGVHIITMRWFKVISIDANEDSPAVEESPARRHRPGHHRSQRRPHHHLNDRLTVTPRAT